MPRVPGLAAAFAILVLVMGCVPIVQGPGLNTADVTANAIAGGEIEVTPLDAAAVPPAQAEFPAAARPRETGVAAPQADPPEPDAAAAAPAPVPTVEVPEVVKSAAQIACEKKGSRWTSVGKSTLKACVKVTKDSNKQCTRASQCESTCLARSGTCAPFKPLLGCNEILQNDGSRVTMCIE